LTTAIEYNIDEIYKITGGEKYFNQPGFSLEFLSLDSRKIIVPNKTVFWALNTHTRNASVFIYDLYESGVRNFVVDTIPDFSKIPDSNVIVVKDPLKALQKLATSHRKKFRNIHVIAITGSNGKTVVKEWLSELLSKDHQIVTSPRSYNSQIGVALSVLQIRSHHTIGIFEAGISTVGEMANLESMIRPQTGIFTNIGSAHDEGFANRAQKISEKLQLFRNVRHLIYPSAIQQITAEIKKNNPGVELFSWGKRNSFFKVGRIKELANQSIISLRSEKREISLTIPFTDTAYVENAISCYCALESMNVFDERMSKEFLNLSSLPMRLELKPGIQGSNIINDTYNNDLQSLGVALDFLHQQTNKKKIVFISDILQSGLTKDHLYRRVSQLLTNKPVDTLIAVGNDLNSYQKLFSGIPHRYFFKNTGDLIPLINNFKVENADILIKGARRFAFENITSRLEAQLHKTRLTINLSHLIHNIGIYKSLLRPGTKMMMMVKAFAYGSGSREIASVLQFIKVDYLTVAYIDEGITLRNEGIHLPIMVMNTEPSSFENLTDHRLEPEIFSFGMLNQFSQFLAAKKIKEYPVHIKIDTGMHRLGFEPNQINKLIEVLNLNKSLRVKSVFSHLSASDDPGQDDFTLKQFRTFNSVIKKLKDNLGYSFISHIANSAGISRFPAMQLDMVRLGIGMYGIDPNPGISRQLKVVNSLSATVSQIKKIKAGEVVGYGVHRIKKDKTIATVSIGYADGYHRLLSMGRGKMWLRGKFVPTEGRICMDMTMIDISGIPEATEGDEVEIFGEHVPVQQLALSASTIPYEIFTSISGRVKRVYVED